MTEALPDSAPDASRAHLVAAIDGLAAQQPQLATKLGALAAAIAIESARNPRLSKALASALSDGAGEGALPTRSGKKARRPPGPWDPFSVYAEVGVEALKERLTGLSLEELRNIVAEHGMDTDRLAMKWKDPNRVIARIIDRVVDRAAKGDGFRGHSGPEPHV